MQNDDINNNKILEKKKIELTFDIKEKLKKYNSFLLSDKIKKNENDQVITAYIIDNNLIDYKCKKCNQGPIWNKKPIQLVLDRMNNILSDNKLENLRFLCPNCFSQLNKRHTIFKKMIKNKQDICIECGKKIKSKSTSYKNIKTKSMRCKLCLNKNIMMREDEFTYI
tara:strand:- start:20 stop:520 length:501 start_codon:yes stop_codon:yes gene_type:complete